MQNQLIKTVIKPLFSFIFIRLLFAISLILPQISVASAKLDAVKKELVAHKNKNTNQKIQQRLLEKQVKNAELKTAKISFNESQTENKIDKEILLLKQIESESIQLRQKKEKQQKLLEQQLISTYMAGHHDLMKLILNQEDISKIIRAKSYYLYLNRARLEILNDLQSTVKKLQSNLSIQKQSLARLKKLNAQQHQVKIALNRQSKVRNHSLRKLNKNLSYNQSKIQQLVRSQEQLKKQLRREQQAKQEQALAMAKVLANKKIIIKQKNTMHSSITKNKGLLKWPIRGKVLNIFGSQRSKQVKWKGIAISANEGEKVRAVATGRVLFAGYFQGYGMVIALDHGDNYLTLYGYNQTLLHHKGEIVFSGDAIALAGHSGGQDKDSLYFEISYKGKAQDPLKWLKKNK
ncbi:MAG: peptidoglycan DD-metalloendopeptidase family protein [Psychromonas sp.]|nr:peptidoglycan DD-metalloendopeptidase family protein [Psychromonas sp.]